MEKHRAHRLFVEQRESKTPAAEYGVAKSRKAGASLRIDPAKLPILAIGPHIPEDLGLAWRSAFRIGKRHLTKKQGRSNAFQTGCRPTRFRPRRPPQNCSFWRRDWLADRGHDD